MKTIVAGLFAGLLLLAFDSSLGVAEVEEMVPRAA